jgi:hypothetical protein
VDEPQDLQPDDPPGFSSRWYDQRVKRVTGELDLAKVTEHELDVLDVRLDRPPARPRERVLVTLDPDD